MQFHGGGNSDKQRSMVVDAPIANLVRVGEGIARDPAADAAITPKTSPKPITT